MSYRLLLLSAQIADSNFNDAIATATGAIKLDPGNYVPLVWRAYLYQKLGNRAQAVSDLNAALATPNLTEIEKKNIRLIAADAALASGDFRAAQELLADYSKTDPAVVTRLGDADATAEKKATLKSDGKLMPMPVQICRDTPYGSVCSLEAPLVLSIAIPVIPVDKEAESFEAAGKAYQASRARNYSLAIEEARKAVEASPETVANRLLLVNLMITAGRPADAEVAASRAIAQGQGTAEIYAQRGYARNLQQIRVARWLTGRPLCSAGCRRIRRGTFGCRWRMPPSPQRSVARTTRPSEDARELRHGDPPRLRPAGARSQGKSIAEFRTAERLGATVVQRDEALRAQINTLLELKRKPEARAIFDQAIARGRLRTMRDADLAYLAVAVGNDEVALAPLRSRT